MLAEDPILIRFSEHSVFRPFACLVGLACFPIWAAAAMPSGAESQFTFEQHIRPIFKAHCFQCHGAKAEYEGGLDLRLVRLLKQGGDSGPAIVPGKQAESLLMARLLADEMPPGENTKLSAHDIDLIGQWLD